MNRPTAAQRKVLEAMRDGRVLHWMGGLYPRAFLSAGQATVRTDTVLAMDKAGWVKREGEFGKYLYALTDLGRAALRRE
jgi:hypothetical protein